MLRNYKIQLLKNWKEKFIWKLKFLRRSRMSRNFWLFSAQVQKAGEETFAIMKKLLLVFLKPFIMALTDTFQTLYHQTLAIRPKLIELIGKYSQKKGWSYLISCVSFLTSN